MPLKFVSLELDGFAPRSTAEVVENLEIFKFFLGGLICVTPNIDLNPVPACAK